MQPQTELLVVTVFGISMLIDAILFDLFGFLGPSLSSTGNVALAGDWGKPPAFVCSPVEPFILRQGRSSREPTLV